MVLEALRKYQKAGEKKRKEEMEKNRLADEQRRRKAEEKKKKDLEEYERQQEAKTTANKIEEVADDTPVGVQKEKAKKEKEKETVEEKKEETAGETKDAEEDDSPPPLGNGGTTDRYVWTQTLGTLEVQIPVRPGTKAKQIICDFGTDTLKLQIKGDDPIIQGKLHSKIKPDDSMWTLIDNKIVQVSFEKADQMKWWSTVMEGDAEIDTKKIVPENSKLGDLDGETRQTVEKMMFDQRQKALNLPTSDQQKQSEMLEKFKAAHPEMDFSNCKMNFRGSGGSFNFGQ